MMRTDGGGLLVQADAFGEASTFALMVRQVRWEANDVISIELTAPDEGPLPSWEPGAHIDVFLESGLVRQYSLCGDHRDRGRYRIAVLREAEGRGGSAEIHREARAGGLLTVGRPRNLFRVPEAPGYLCLAGGVGVTPILSIARNAQESGVPFRMVYGGQSRRSMAFVAELRAMVPQSALEVVPQDERGLIDLEDEVSALPEGWVICACGPPAMLETLEGVCDRQGVRSRLVVERFTSSPELGAEYGDTENRPVTVHLERSGVTVEVAADQSILSAVQDVAPVISSCTEGYCGTCETRVLRGVPEHRDTVLTEEEQESNKIMMICVSRAKNDELTLDL